MMAEYALDMQYICLIQKMHQLKYTGFLLRRVSAIESSHPQRLQFTKEIRVQGVKIYRGRW
jgi:hypothetical protein